MLKGKLMNKELEKRIEERAEITTLKGEIWSTGLYLKTVYKISNLGRVAYHKNGKFYLRKLDIRSNGYYFVSFTCNGKLKSHTVHRLVAMHFIDNPLNLPCVNHRNHDRLDNRADNLEWTTYSENVKDSIKDGARQPKITKREADFIRFLRDKYPHLIQRKWHLTGKLIKFYGMSGTNIQAIYNGRIWK